MANKATFHPYGISIPTENGDLVLNAGANMTILPQGNLITFAAQVPQSVASINGISGDITISAGPGITLNITDKNIQIQSGNSYVTESGFNVYVTEDGSGNYIVE